MIVTHQWEHTPNPFGVRAVKVNGHHHDSGEHPEAIVTPMIVPHGTDSAYLHKRGVIKYGFTPMILGL